MLGNVRSALGVRRNDARSRSRGSSARWTYHRVNVGPRRLQIYEICLGSRALINMSATFSRVTGFHWDLSSGNPIASLLNISVSV
jgi:hypothetical protein